mmetsp:Transcript_17645/g.34715  ORF Transcript_17645/g.34715 Transcript_17645/m.34715 type:complete len:200 (+) Transcript_17645:1183-1782(+)
MHPFRKNLLPRPRHHHQRRDHRRTRYLRHLRRSHLQGIAECASSYTSIKILQEYPKKLKSPRPTGVSTKTASATVSPAIVNLATLTITPMAGRSKTLSANQVATVTSPPLIALTRARARRQRTRPPLVSLITSTTNLTRKRSTPPPPHPRASTTNLLTKIILARSSTMWWLNAWLFSRVPHVAKTFITRSKMPSMALLT